MPEQLAHRDLRNNSAQVLRDVAAGATFEITNHGEVVAVLSPPTPGLGQLRVRPRRSSAPFAAIRRTRTAESTATALEELRGDR